MKKKSLISICRILAVVLAVLLLLFTYHCSARYEMTGYEEKVGSGAALQEEQKMEEKGMPEPSEKNQIEILAQGQVPGTGDTTPLIGLLFLIFCSLFLGILEILRKIQL